MIQKPKGTYDLYGKNGKTVRYIENVVATLMENYHYEYVKTPIIEASELFHRGVGEATDIVTKETYDFKDRGDRDLTLRPEGTAGVVRSFIENKRYGDPSQPIKNWYFGPMYRYERPQSGRYREFTQFGVEVFGSSDPMMDAEVISIPVVLYQLLGLKGIKVNINSLGDQESRDSYRNALLAYFKPHLNELCEDCKSRYEKNPMRILDCKVDHDLEFMKNAPKTIDYLNEASRKHFEKVQGYLKALEISFTVDPRVVRGLDYYSHTVFEVEAKIEGFGAQNVLCGGGRYDHLVETLGGPSTPAVGFALGLERLLSALEYEQIDPVLEDDLDIYLIPMMEEAKAYTFTLTNILRLNGFKAEIDMMNRSLKSNFKECNRNHARYLAIIGEEEIKSNIITIKNNETEEEEKVAAINILQYLDEVLEESCDCCEDHCSGDHDEHCCEEHCGCTEEHHCHCHEEEENE